MSAEFHAAFYDLHDATVLSGSVGPMLAEFLDSSLRSVRPCDITEALQRSYGCTASIRRWDIDGNGVLVGLVFDVEDFGALPRDGLFQSRQEDVEGEFIAPWEQPGWFGRACVTIDAILSNSGLTRLARPRQYRHSPLGAVLSVETAQGRAWFKTGFSLHGQEFAVLETLQELYPSSVPSILGGDGDGWLMSDGCAGVIPEGDVSPYVQLAEMQRASLGGLDRLAGAGLRGRSLSDIGDFALALARAQGPDWVPDETVEALARGLPAVQDSLNAVRALDIPDSLVHGDFHPENRIRAEAGWRFLDWSDCFLGHPLLDLALTPHYEDAPYRATALEDMLSSWGVRCAGLERKRLEHGVAQIGLLSLALSYVRLDELISAPYRPWARKRALDWLERLS